MVIPVSSFTEVEEFRGDGHGDDISNAAGMSKLSVSMNPSLVFSAMGRELSIELSLQYRLWNEMKKKSQPFLMQYSISGRIEIAAM